MHLFTKAPLGSNAKTVSHKKHSDHGLRIDRWAPRVAIEICQMSPDAAEFEMTINRPQKMILMNMIFHREHVGQRRLRFLPLPHHR